MTTRDIYEQLKTKHKYNTIGKEIIELVQADVIKKQSFEGYPKYERVSESNIVYRDAYKLYKHVDKERYALLTQSTGADGLTRGQKFELDYSDPQIIQEMLAIIRKTSSNVIVGLLRAAAFVILIIGIVVSFLDCAKRWRVSDLRTLQHLHLGPRVLRSGADRGPFGKHRQSNKKRLISAVFFIFTQH